MKEVIKILFFKLCLPLVYAVGCLQKLQNASLAVSAQKTKGEDDFAAVETELQKLGISCDRFSLGGERGMKHYYLAAIQLAFVAPRYRYLLLSDSLNVLLVLPIRKKSHLIQLWHACGAFKKWGYATLDNTFGESEKSLRRYYRHDKYSLMSVSADYVIPCYEAAFGLAKGSGIVKALGVGRTDGYFDQKTSLAARKEVEEIYPAAAGKKILLFAPTFRGEHENALPAAAPDFSALSKDWFVIVRQHPAVKEDAAGDGLSLKTLLFAADAAITDYSSWIFEYALLDKPLFFYAADLASYDTERGFFEPYEKMIPAPFFTESAALCTAIEKGEFDKQAMSAFRQKYMSACDGNSARRIADAIRSL